MMKFILPVFALIATLFIFESCKKNEAALSDPHPLLLLPKKEGNRLSNDQLDHAKMYYFQNGQRYIKDFGRASGNSFQKGILKTSDIATLSAVEEIKSYYLEFPDGTIDTLFVDYNSISEKEGRKNECFCDKPLRGIKINFATPSQESVTAEGIPIFIVNK